MGYDDIWMGEHHFDEHWPQGAPMPLLGHLAAVTSKARIGSMALWPALSQPLALAQELATLDLLSKGRLNVGVASGGAFPLALSAHGLTRQAARASMHTTMDEVAQLLGGTSVVPQPSAMPLPTYLASDNESSIRKAAQQGWGLMSAATHTASRIQRKIDIYKDASGGRAPALVLARFACTGPTRAEALAVATPYFEALAERARAQGWGPERDQSIARDVQALIDQSLVGSYSEVAQQFKAWGEQHGVTGIAIIPTSAQFDTHKHILAHFVDQVRPLLDED
jgi:alkanesulfonate monooxygenase SsuD/methylene tetrahydromethanopterin reductase-like flavin-dependent oxidoreductase (luciferase family)